MPRAVAASRSAARHSPTGDAEQRVELAEFLPDSPAIPGGSAAAPCHGHGTLVETPARGVVRPGVVEDQRSATDEPSAPPERREGSEVDLPVGAALAVFEAPGAELAAEPVPAEVLIPRATQGFDDEQDDPFVRELAELLSTVDDASPGIQPSSKFRRRPPDPNAGAPIQDAALATQAESFSLEIDALPALEPLELDDLESLDDSYPLQDIQLVRRLAAPEPLADLEPLDDGDLFATAPSPPSTQRSTQGIGDASPDQQCRYVGSAG